MFIDTDDLSKKKLAAVYRAPTPEMICYLDFSVSTTGMLAGVKVCCLKYPRVLVMICYLDNNRNVSRS